MIICICYNLNEDTINKALEEGIVPAKMYDHFECDGPCEVCMEMIEEIFVENEQK